MDIFNNWPHYYNHKAHCFISLLPRFTYSAIVDLRTECKNPNASRQRPARIALYETQPSGVVRQAYKFFDNLVNTCIGQIESCTCDTGCPSCELIFNSILSNN